MESRYPIRQYVGVSNSLKTLGFSALRNNGYFPGVEGDKKGSLQSKHSDNMVTTCDNSCLTGWVLIHMCFSIPLTYAPQLSTVTI